AYISRQQQCIWNLGLVDIAKVRMFNNDFLRGLRQGSNRQKCSYESSIETLFQQMKFSANLYKSSQWAGRLRINWHRRKLLETAIIVSYQKRIIMYRNVLTGLLSLTMLGASAQTTPNDAKKETGKKVIYQVF